MLVCIKCARPVVFSDNGWIHRQESSDCGRPAIAWPPAVAEADEDPNPGEAEHGTESAA